MTEPKVSVIILTYNRAILICKTLESILNQKYNNLEIIIIDDGSKDDTLKRLQTYNDSRIQIESVKHSGHISNLRNYGLKKSKGEYISFLDSDDIWDIDHLYNQVLILNNNKDSGFIFSDIELIENNKVIKKDIYKNKITSKYNFNIFNHIISGNITPIRPSTLLFRRSCIINCGVYNENLLVGDYNFLLKLAYNFNACFCNSPLVKILKHKDNISDYIQIEDFNEVIFTLKELYKINYISKKIYKARVPFFQYKILRKQIQRKDFFKAFKQFIILLSIDPFFLIDKIFKKYKLK